MKEPAVVCKENNLANASGKVSVKPVKSTMDRNRAQVLCLSPGRQEARVWLQTGHACIEEDRN